MNDITGLEDIKLFVNDFYGKIRNDDLLAPIFAMRIEGDNWDIHLNRMYSFWNTVLFADRSYSGRPFPKHIGLPVSQEHFTRWVSLLTETIDTHFKGEKADEVKWRAGKMALMFQSKIDYYNSRNIKPLM